MNHESGQDLSRSLPLGSLRRKQENDDWLGLQSHLTAQQEVDPYLVHSHGQWKDSVPQGLLARELSPGP